MIAIMERPAREPIQLRPRAPNLLAQEITGRTYLSHTQISLMRACPRKFFHTYVEKASKDFLPCSLLLGSAIHSVLEAHFRARLEGLDTTHAALHNVYHDAWSRLRNEAGENILVRFNKGEDENSTHALADRLITAFLNSPLASPKGTILAVEEQMRVVLAPELPDLLAVIDLVTLTDGAMHIIDFKTSRSRWNEEKAQELSGQLVMYHVAARRMSMSLGLPVKLHFAVLTKAKKPVVQLLPVAHQPQRMAALAQLVRQVWETIQVGNFYPAPHPMRCTSCPFRSRCPVFGGR